MALTSKPLSGPLNPDPSVRVSPGLKVKSLTLGFQRGLRETLGKLPLGFSSSHGLPRISTFLSYFSTFISSVSSTQKALLSARHSFASHTHHQVLSFARAS